MRVADFNNLEQRILDNRKRQTSSDIADRSTFFLRLLHAAVHEHGATTSQVNGMFCRNSGLCEVGNVQIQAACEALDEASAARRACFVQHDVLDNTVFHAQALHVLAANVQDELNARQHFLRAAQVRDRLDFARINAQGFQQQAFAITGHGSMSDSYQRFSLLIARKQRVKLIERRSCAAQNVAFVAYVA